MPNDTIDFLYNSTRLNFECQESPNLHSKFRRVDSYARSLIKPKRMGKPMENVRLQKYLANAGVASRRKSEEIIIAGRVSVNGKITAELGTKVSQSDIICIDGKQVKIKAKQVYIMLHKPEGVITSVSDPQGRPVVLDYIKDIEARLFPVGRLDYDSSGLLLLTTDGNLAQKLTHPGYRVPKTYIAHLRGIPSKEGIRAFKEGIKIDEGPKTSAAKIKILDIIDKRSCTVQITIKEGRNRQVRKMCDAVGCPVLSLKRVGMGALKLGSLPKGKYRHLTKEEVSNVSK